MRKIVGILLFLSLCLFPRSAVLADYFAEPPHTVPHTVNGHTYDQMVQQIYTYDLASSHYCQIVFYFDSSYFSTAKPVISSVDNANNAFGAYVITTNRPNIYDSDTGNFDYNLVMGNTSYTNPDFGMYCYTTNGGATWADYYDIGVGGPSYDFYGDYTYTDYVRSTLDLYWSSQPFVPNNSLTNQFQDGRNRKTDRLLVPASIFAGGGYHLTINLSPQAGGTVVLSPSGGSYVLDTEVEVTATAASGYVFGYFDDGQSCYTENPLTITMDSAKIVTAVFQTDPFEMKLPLLGDKSWLLSVEAGGEIQCNGGTDTYHTGTEHYALDFTDNTQEDGHLQGIDVPILAAQKGIVEFAGGDPNDNGWGYTVLLNHGNGYKTRYAHMKYDPTVSGTVIQGQQIGVMGSTGGSTGIHLHFQVYHNGDSSSTNTALQSICLEGQNLDYYQVGCNNFYASTNE